MKGVKCIAQFKSELIFTYQLVRGTQYLATRDSPGLTIFFQMSIFISCHISKAANPYSGLFDVVYFLKQILRQNPEQSLYIQKETDQREKINRPKFFGWEMDPFSTLACSIRGFRVKQNRIFLPSLASFTHITLPQLSTIKSFNVHAIFMIMIAMFDIWLLRLIFSISSWSRKLYLLYHIK